MTTGINLRRAWHPDRLAAVAIIVLCAGVYAATLEFDTVSAVIAQGMGPEAFPRLVIGVIAVLAALLAFSSGSPDDAPAEPVSPMVMYTGAVLLGFMALIPVLGMLASMAVLVVGLGRLWGERRMWRLCVAAALLCGAVWAVFVRGFRVPLPAGMLRQLIS